MEKLEQNVNFKEFETWARKNPGLALENFPSTLKTNPDLYQELALREPEEALERYQDFLKGK